MTRVNQRPFGQVRELPSGRFQARWKGADGHYHNGPHTFATRDAAKTWLAAQRVERADGSWIDERAGAIPFADYAASWTVDAEATLRPSSYARDVGYLKRYLLPAFGATPLADIDVEAVRRFVTRLGKRTSLRGEPLAAATVTKAGQVLSKILRQAVDDRRIPSNPVEKVKLPRPGRPEMHVLDPGEILELADAMDRRYRALILLGCYGGLRIGEMVALRVGDVDTAAGVVRVVEGVTEVSGKLHRGTTKTRAGVRVVPLPAFVIDAVVDHVEDRRLTHRDDILFPAPEGGLLRLSNFRKHQWGPALRRAGLVAFRIHDMRHTAITLWLKAGIDPKLIAKRAGHTSVVTVLDRYAHADANDRAGMAELDALGAPARRRGGASITRIPR